MKSFWSASYYRALAKLGGEELAKITGAKVDYEACPDLKLTMNEWFKKIKKEEKERLKKNVKS